MRGDSGGIFVSTLPVFESNSGMCVSTLRVCEHTSGRAFYAAAGLVVEYIEPALPVSYAAPAPAAFAAPVPVVLYVTQ